MFIQNTIFSMHATNHYHAINFLCLMSDYAFIRYLTEESCVPQSSYGLVIFSNQFFLHFSLVSFFSLEDRRKEEISHPDSPSLSHPAKPKLLQTLQCRKISENNLLLMPLFYTEVDFLHGIWLFLQQILTSLGGVLFLAKASWARERGP